MHPIEINHHQRSHPKIARLIESGGRVTTFKELQLQLQLQFHLFIVTFNYSKLTLEQQDNWKKRNGTWFANEEQKKKLI